MKKRRWLGWLAGAGLDPPQFVLLARMQTRPTFAHDKRKQKRKESEHLSCD
jgi:hypothetical protein